MDRTAPDFGRTQLQHHSTKPSILVQICCAFFYTSLASGKVGQQMSLLKKRVYCRVASIYYLSVILFSSFAIVIFSNVASQNDQQINVDDKCIGETQLEAESSTSAECSSAKEESSVEHQPEKPVNRSKKTDGEICLSSKWITDVDHIEVSAEKRKQMMRKARAISRAISKKAAVSRQSLPASNVERLPRANEPSMAETESQSDFVQTATKIESKQGVTGKSGWRIPRMQNVQAITEPAGDVGSQPSLVSKVSPPLSKDTSSSFGWQRRGHKTGRCSKEIGGKTSHHSFISHRVSDNKTEIAAAGLFASSQMRTTASCQSVIPSVTEEKGGDSSVAEVVTEMSAEVNTPDDMSSCRDSSQNLLCVPSQEVIEKIQAFLEQKSAILLPNTVPACGERGMAVGFEVLSQKNLHLKPRTAETECSVTTSSTELILPVIVNTSASVSQSVATKKRKLNISQYKSILPQRRKTLLQSVAVTQPAERPSVYMYGRYKDVLHDHDYFGEGKHTIGLCSREPTVENTIVLPKTEVVMIKGELRENVVTATAEDMQDKMRSGIATANNTTRSLSPSKVISQSQPSASYSSTAFKSGQELELVSKVSESRNSSSSVSQQNAMVDCMPAYFDVVSLPNRQTKISVSAATLITKKVHNSQSVITAGDTSCTKQVALVDHADTMLHREEDVSLDADSRISGSPSPESEEATVERCFSRSSSVSSAISVSSDEASSRSRSRSRSSSRYHSSCESSYSSDSWSENFVIKFVMFCFQLSSYVLAW